MFDDQRALGGRGADGSPLAALGGVVQGQLVGPLCDAEALHTDMQAGIVHHGEHRLHALVDLADQVADGAVVVAELHYARWAAVDADLVFDG